MRPIYLKLAGLNSFRERQEIDFEQLCQGGVFGIFGPTGSGKSSILDAITLALYGKVERASNNTTGIMNQAEDRLSVSFTFELRNANGSNRYLVERSYKRSDDHRLRSASSRLVELIPEEQVLADKDREVTATVEKILGLTSEDFTRAVVLPQGKFAEFITLNGSDRRRMLQRLFHLEKYGDRLTARLKERKDAVEIQIKEIVAEQAGLGDCSEERMKQAEQHLHAVIAVAEQKRAQLINAEKVYNEKKEIWQRQQEKLEVERSLAELREQEQGIKELEQRLERAKQADRLQPYLEELLRSEQEEQQWRTKAVEYEVLNQEAQQQYEVNQQAYSKARESRGSEEPQLVIQLESLKTAQALDQQIKQIEQEQATQLAILERLNQEQQANSLELEKVTMLLVKAKQLQSELKMEMEQNTVKAEVRGRITQAMQLKQSYDHLQKEHRTAHLDRVKKDEQLAALLKQEELLTQTISELHKRMVVEVNELVELDSMLDKLVVSLKQLEARSAKTLQEQKYQLVEVEKRRLAHQLIEQLREGEACPLCGSIDHPNPAQVEGELITNEASIAQQEELLLQIKEKIQEIKQLTYQLDQVSKRLDQIPFNDQSLRTEIASSRDQGLLQSLEADVIAENYAYSDAEITLQMQQLAEEYGLLSDSVKTLTVQLNRNDQTTLKLITELSSAHQKKSEWQIHHTTAQQLLTESSVREEQISTELGNLRSTWEAHYPDLLMEKIEEVHAELDQRALEVEKLQERITKSVIYIEEQESNYKRIDTVIRENHLSLAKVEAEIKGREAGLREHKERLQQLTLGKEIDQLFHSTTTRLETLRHLEEQARARLVESEQLLRQRESQYKAAEQSAVIAKERLQTSKQKWGSLLQSTHFQAREAVTTAILPTAEQTQSQTEIDRYRDALKAIEIKLSNLQVLLEDKSVTAELWEETQLAQQLAKQEDEAALQEKARAERDYEDLTQKQVRWQQLEQARITVNEMRERLVSLQTVFRGNAFVDFIAEEQLIQISRDASIRLRNLTRGRYAIEVDSSEGFVICDDANGGIKRPVTTLSGGETFLTSLALALSLSAQVQLRGEYPLEFFFLDEGFGTLDQDLLETVVTALEKLHSDSLSVGVISHVPELKERLARKIIVEPAEASGRGSRVELQLM